MAEFGIWIGRMFLCRCGQSYFIRHRQGKPESVSLHQQSCLVAPGDTVPQKDGMGWQMDDTLMVHRRHT